MIIRRRPAQTKQEQIDDLLLRFLLLRFSV
jgi:hypothetical protein